MRHQYKVKKLGRKSSHRKQLVNNLVKSLLIHRSIQTTISKAKVVQNRIDKIFTMARGESRELAFRQINSMLNDENLTNKIFDYYLNQIERTSGYTTRYILKNRKGDNAVLVMVKLLTKEEVKEKTKAEKKEEKEVKKEEKKKSTKKENKKEDKKLKEKK